MAKGLGALMAEMAMSEKKAALKHDPACPLCGEPMVGNGVVWSCVAHNAQHKEWLRSRQDAAFETSEAGEVVFFIDLRTAVDVRIDNWDPELQGALMAMAFVPEGGTALDDVWTFETRRGYARRTTFVASPPDNFAPGGWIPSDEDWLFLDWTGKGEGGNDA